MRFKEQRLWDRFRKHCGTGHEINLERIENGVSAGMPDVVSCAGGRVCFVEMKSQDHAPKLRDTPVLGREGFSQVQMNWAMNWRRHGGTVYGLVSIERLHYLIPGEHIDRVNWWRMCDYPLLAVAQDWETVRIELRGRV